MKIQGRFIAVLAVLGLLIALLPLAPAGAVTGGVKLTGGAEDKGVYFSDQTNYNILTIDVTDPDLTPTRIGTARTTTGTGAAPDLRGYVVAGEKDQTDRFNGGTTNGPCNEADLEGVNNSPEATDTDFTDDGDLMPGRLTAVTGGAGADPGLVGPAPTGVQNIVNDRCPKTGDGTAIVVVTSTGVAATTGEYDGTSSASDTSDPQNVTYSADYTDTPDRSVVYQYKLSKTARDRQSGTASGVGAVGINDIASVVVNGRTANPASTTAAGGTTVAGGDPAATATASPWYTATVLTVPAVLGSPTAGVEIAGGGISHITVRGSVVPNKAPNSVSVTYRYSEFNFGSEGDPTPLNLSRSSVRYAVAGSTSYSAANNQVTLASVAGTILNLNGDVAGHTVVSFGYDVKDSKDELVTLNSASAGDKQLDTVETSANSNVFRARVAIFESGELDKIRFQAGVTENDGNGDKTIQVTELNHTNGLRLAAAPANDRTLDTRVQMAAEALGLCYTPAATPANGCDDDDDISPASAFVALAIPARHGDVINVVYSDTNPSTRVSKTATVDLEAPVVTLISPTDKLFTNSPTTSFIVDVVDTGAGVPDASNGNPPVILPQQGGSLALQTDNLIRTPIVDGYRLTVNPAGTIAEGAHQWFVGVRDKAGNEPVRDIPRCKPGETAGSSTAPCTGTTANEGARGAAGVTAAEADNPFVFTVDTRAPELSTGKTGLYLKNPGVTSGANQEEEKDNNRTWVRVVFNTHLGTAPLDVSTVSADDFRVDGIAPLDAKVNAKGQPDAPKGTAVYLQVGQLDTDDRPEVQLTGEVRDKAGNIRTDGRLTAIADGLAPILTVTPSADLAESEVTVTISSSETLRSNPTLKWTTTKPTKTTFTEVNPTPVPSVSLQAGSLTKWAATFKNVADQANRWYVGVEGADLGGNSAKVGFANKEGDIVTFQVDDAAPSLNFVDARDMDLEDSKQTEGAVWIVAQFDEDEHADDKSRGVTVTAVTLTDTATDDVITDDASAIFGSEVNCDNHGDAETRQNKCANRTLAVNLTPGAYNIRMTGVDASGNETTGNVDFTVVEAAPFKLGLRPGINFVSIPGMPMGDGGDINAMLGSHPVTTVTTYDRSLELQGQNPWLRSTKDAETGMFSGDITMIEPGKAYFITATASSEVKVKIQTGVTELPPTITVRQGYNAIGYWAVSGDKSAEIDDYLNSIGWTVAYSYDPTPGQGWTVIRRGEVDADGEGMKVEEGKGYLVYATYDSVLTP